MKINPYIKFIIFFILMNHYIYSQSVNIREGKKAFAKKDFKSAIEYFNKEIQTSPNECYGYYYLGLTYERVSEKEKAIPQFQNAIKVQCPNELKEQAYWKIINYYRFIEDWENLYIYTKSFLKFKPNKEVEKYYHLAEKNHNPERLAIKDLLNEAAQLEEDKKYFQAAKKYQELFRTTKNVVYLVKAGNLYKKAGENHKAIEIFENALQYDPNNWYANYELALFRYNNGNPKEAKKHIEISYNNIPKDDVKNLYILHLLKGMILINLDQIEQAQEIFNRIDELLKKHPKQIQREKNYYILASFIKVLKDNNYSAFQKYIEKENFENHLLQMIYNVQSQNIEGLYESCIDFLENYQTNNKFITYSNFINQIYIILLLNERNNINHTEKLLSLKNKLISEPSGNILLKKYLSYKTFLESSNLKENELNLILNELSYENFLSVLLIYNTYQIKDYKSLEKYINQYRNKLQNLNQNRLNAFLYFIDSVIGLFNNQIDEGYKHLENAIKLNPVYKTIAKEDPLIQKIIQEEKQWKNLVEGNTFLDIFTQ